eukprot:TRINITY_DN21791_c0_g1_i2.p1 TRINITY_DN21791_c0_g1~~TRINITY_DN21791_c0_g1_i2.p1  ORF type:complete len:327 (-),score=68.00 TRINITY_DN21791_c0_g1_i2:119-1099(-)
MASAASAAAEAHSAGKAGAGTSAEDGLGRSQPPMRGWLLKRRRHGRGLFGASNRRFLTLDLEGQIFYYSHSESQKHVSRPVPCCSIANVQALTIAPSRSGAGGDDSDDGEAVVRGPPPTVPEGWHAQWSDGLGAYYYFNDDGTAQCDPPPGTVFAEEPASEKPKLTRADSTVSTGSRFGSLGSRLRMPTFGLRRGGGAVRYGFELHLKGPREEKLELLCASQEEADQWITAFNAAMNAAKSSAPAATIEEQSTDGGGPAARDGASDSDEPGSDAGGNAAAAAAGAHAAANNGCFDSDSEDEGEGAADGAPAAAGGRPGVDSDSEDS